MIQGEIIDIRNIVKRFASRLARTKEGILSAVANRTLEKVEVFKKIIDMNATQMSEIKNNYVKEEANENY